jgi:hypothetical protein
LAVIGNSRRKALLAPKTGIGFGRSAPLGKGSLLVLLMRRSGAEHPRIMPTDGPLGLRSGVLIATLAGTPASALHPAVTLSVLVALGV